MRILKRTTYSAPFFMNGMMGSWVKPDPNPPTTNETVTSHTLLKKCNGSKHFNCFRVKEDNIPGEEC